MKLWDLVKTVRAPLCWHVIAGCADQSGEAHLCSVCFWSSVDCQQVDTLNNTQISDTNTHTDFKVDPINLDWQLRSLFLLFTDGCYEGCNYWFIFIWQMHETKKHMSPLNVKGLNLTFKRKFPDIYLMFAEMLIWFICQSILSVIAAGADYFVWILCMNSDSISPDWQHRPSRFRHVSSLQGCNTLHGGTSCKGMVCVCVCVYFCLCVKKATKNSGCCWGKEGV